MTRFSPAYIAYILSDEASVLQEHWEPKAGDWVYGWRYVGVMHGTVKSKTEYEAVVVTGVGCDGVQTPNAYRNAEEVTWLPALSDLLGMIEEAVGDKQFVLGYLGEYHEWYTSLEIIGEETWPIQSSEVEDKLVAAAKLAVRVLEEGKE